MPVGNAATATRSVSSLAGSREAPGNAWHACCRERLAFLLHAVDELHELGRACRGRRSGVVLAGDRVAAEGEEAS